MKKMIKNILIIAIVLIVGIMILGNSGQKDTAKKEQEAQKEEQISRLNKWFKDEYVESMSLYDDEGNFDVYSLKVMTINGFKLNGNDILVVIDHNRMKAEGFTADELVTQGYSALLRYSDKEKLHFDNFDSDDYVNKKPSKYDVTYE